jgi:hypothetical protein
MQHRPGFEFLPSQSSRTCLLSSRDTASSRMAAIFSSSLQRLENANALWTLHATGRRHLLLKRRRKNL